MFRHGGMNAACRPRFEGRHPVPHGRRRRYAMVALKMGGAGELGETDVLWRSNQSPPQKTSPILYKGMLFTMRTQERFPASTPRPASRTGANG